MGKTGINFERCNVGSVELHNDRAPQYLESVMKSGRGLYIFQDRTRLNKSIVNPNYNGLSVAEIFERQKSRYKEKVGQEPNLKDRVVVNNKTGKERVIAGWSPLREGVCPIKEDTKLEDFKPFIDWCADNGLNVIRIDLHFDEGYESEKKERKYNRHAHIVVDWMNWTTGKTAKLDASKMSEAQDIIAESLGMERGEKKLETGKEHMAPAQFREKKAEEYAIKLEADNRDLKAENDKLRQVNTGLKAKIKDTWQHKGRAETAEAALEEEKKAHKDDVDQINKTLAETKKEVEIERKRANEAESVISHYRRENNRLHQELQRKTVQANRWERMYNDLFRKEEPKKGISR